MNMESNTCRIAGRCRLGRALEKATAAFLAVLDDVTLEDLCGAEVEWLDALSLSEQAR